MNKKIAEKAYNHYLKLIEAKYGNKETSTNELNSIGKKLFKNKFVGVFPSDKIPKMKNNQYAIINLDKSDQSGSHWVSIVKSKNGIYIYDSFGRRTIKILPSLKQSGNGMILETENDAEQKEIEENCGQRSLASLCVYDNFGHNGLKYI